MKITEDNIIQLKNYWGGNRTTKDIIPSEMKISVSDIRDWFNGFLNENGIEYCLQYLEKQVKEIDYDNF